jgi:hypothetical protein
MNKLIIATLISMISLTANAEYTMMFPLEMANGGTLPNGSINFTKASVDTPAQPTVPPVVTEPTVPAPTAPVTPGMTAAQCSSYNDALHSTLDPSSHGFPNAAPASAKLVNGICSVNILSDEKTYSSTCTAKSRSEYARLTSWISANNKTPVVMIITYIGYVGACE